MEHRCGMRTAANVKATIDYQPLGAIHGVITDVSPSGLFIKIPRADLELNRPVRITLGWRIRGVRRSVSFRAIVARATDEGVGVMFGEQNELITKLLREILRPATTRKPAVAASRARADKANNSERNGEATPHATQKT